jgi:serine/threonine-protein kinase
MSTCDSLRILSVAPLALVVTALGASPAHAQAQDQAAARALFNDARERMSRGRFDEACPKLEAASKLYPGSGVLLNLADCYEHLGRTASAWHEFGEAASAAERAGRAEDQAEAHKRQAALDPKLSKIVIHVTKAPPGLVVKRDDTALDPAAWGIAIPIDPGSHTVTVEGAGRSPWSTTVKVADPGKTITVDVPDSVESEVVAPVSSPPQAPMAVDGAETHPVESGSYWTGRRVAGIAIAGLGVVTFGVGGILGLEAKSKFNIAQGESSPSRENDSASAYSLGNVATGFVIGGAVVAAAGLVVWLTAPGAPVQVGANGGQAIVRGTF